MPVYDSDSMAIAAGQVEKLKDEFEKSKHKVTGLDHEKEESVDDVRDKAYPESRRAGGRFHARRVGGDDRGGRVRSGRSSRP